MDNWTGLLGTVTVKVYEEMKGKWHLKMPGFFINKECALPQSEQESDLYIR